MMQQAAGSKPHRQGPQPISGSKRKAVAAATSAADLGAPRSSVVQHAVATAPAPAGPTKSNSSSQSHLPAAAAAAVAAVAPDVAFAEVVASGPPGTTQMLTLGGRPAHRQRKRRAHAAPDDMPPPPPLPVTTMQHWSGGGGGSVEEGSAEQEWEVDEGGCAAVRRHFKHKQSAPSRPASPVRMHLRSVLANHHHYS